MSIPIFVGPISPGDPDYDAVTAELKDHAQTKVKALPARNVTLAHHPTWLEATRTSPRSPVQREATERDLGAAGAAVAAVQHVLTGRGPIALAAVPCRSGPSAKEALIGLAGEQAYNVPAIALAYAKHLRETIQKNTEVSRLHYYEGHGPLCPSAVDECLHRRLIELEEWSFSRVAADLTAEDGEIAAMEVSKYGLEPGISVPWLSRVDCGGVLRDLLQVFHEQEKEPTPHLVVYEASDMGLGPGDGCIRASPFQLLLRDKLVIEACARNDWPLVILVSQSRTVGVAQATFRELQATG